MFDFMATTAQDSNGDNNWRFIILLLIFIFGMFLMFIMQSCNVTRKVTDNSKIEREDSVSTSTLHFDNNLTLTLHDDRESGKWNENLLHITFGAGGGTYNAKTGEANNVSSVKESNKGYEKVIEHKDSIINSLTTIIEAKNDSISRLKQQNDIETENKVEDSAGKWIVIVIAIYIFGFFTPFILKKIPQTSWLLFWYK